MSIRWNRGSLSRWGALFLVHSCAMLAAPPFWGTIFVDPDIVVESDPSAFQTLEDKGRGSRVMFDRRVNGWVTLNAFLFEARFDDGLAIEVQVNPEFENAAAARAEAMRYMHATGQLPAALRAEVRTMWIHQGLQPFGGGNNNLLIHAQQAEAYIRDGILEETLMHEATHTSLDGRYAGAAGWLAAQVLDGEFISNYARDFPAREDLAETFVPYFAARFRADRISGSMADVIWKTIPNRISFLDGLLLDMHPADRLKPLAFTDVRFDRERGALHLAWNSRSGQSYAIEFSADLSRWREIPENIPAAGAVTTFEINAEWLEIPRFFRVREAN